MPRQRTPAKGFPCEPDDCFDSRHLDGSLYKVYSVMKGFARAGRTSRHGRNSDEPLLFTAAVKPTLCNAVCLSKNQTYAVRDKLAELGWIVLREKGTPKPDGSRTPDTWEVLEHEEYVKKHPGSCPSYEYAPDFETAQAAGVRHGQRLRESGPVPYSFFPRRETAKTRAIVEVLENLTEEELAEIYQRLENGPHPAPVEFSLPVPNDRARHQSLTTGTAPVPNDEEPQSLSTGCPSPYPQDAPVPNDEEHQSLTIGKNLNTASEAPPTKTPTTTTTTILAAAPLAKGGSGSGGGSLSSSLLDEEPIVEEDCETNYIPEEKPWLREIWQAAREHDGDNVYNTVLPFRSQKNERRKVSEDIWEVDKLIEQMCDKKKCDWEKAAQQVRAAWTYFAHNPFPNCKPIKIGYDDNKDATLFPVTVFVKNFDAYYTAAVNECATYGKAAYPPKWLATWRAYEAKAAGQ